MLKKIINPLSLIIFTVAFCSIVYELVLGQTLTAFLGNTVLRFSITIGLYMFSMGFGAMLAEGKFLKDVYGTFMKIELGLTLLGGLVVTIFFFLSFIFSSGIIFVALTHLLIIAIGTLTGFEIPLLIEMYERKKDQGKAAVLGIDYLGALAGTLVFAFVFYPRWGLLPAALATGILNALAGISIYFIARKEGETRREHSRLLYSQLLLFFLLTVLLFWNSSVNDWLIGNYLK